MHNINKKIKTAEEFIAFLKNSGKPIVIQTHNFPDHDAIASAFGLQVLFSRLGITSTIVYGGDVQRDSLRDMVKKFGITAVPIRKFKADGEALITLVDVCKGNKNVSCLSGTIVGIVDHHESPPPDDVAYADIQSELGSCSTLVANYYERLKVEVPREVATALLIGLNIDTAFLTRGAGDEDLRIYFSLRKLADNDFVSMNVRNYIQKVDLGYFKYAIDNAIYHGEFAFCYFPEGCNPNLLGILADFFLALKEITFVTLCARNEGKIFFSVRSEKKCWNAATIVQTVLEGVGFGGGHFDMAGGIILDPSNFDEKTILRKFIATLDR